MARRAADFRYVSRQEYLDGERVAATKSEWVDGVVYAMAGASKRHVGVVSRLMELLAGAGRTKGCLVGSSDLLVETATANYYPDVVVSCHPSDDPYVEHNPRFIAEVLSPSTNRVDKIEKRDAYLALPSLETYWIVDPDANIIEVWERSDSGWTGHHHTAAEAMTVACLGVTVRVVDIVGP
jgi:Uma2 family endonuclease